VASGLLASAASAHVACNRWHECWRVNDRHDYPPRIGGVVHNDRWADNHRHGWRWRNEHRERGYYRDGGWITY
jgi:hypothetical protein